MNSGVLRSGGERASFLFLIRRDGNVLEHILCQVDANSRSLPGRRPSRFKRLAALLLWHIDAGSGGGVHPIGSGPRRAGQ